MAALSSKDLRRYELLVVRAHRKHDHAGVILKHEKSVDPPAQQSTMFELVIALTTAEAPSSEFRRILEAPRLEAALVLPSL